jgi:beta-fructofuranosidase
VIKRSIHPKKANVIKLDVLRSPGKEEYTLILFHDGRGNRHREWGRLDPRARRFDSALTTDSSMASTLPDIRTRPPESGAFRMQMNELLDLRVFIDRSVVEVFENGKQCVAMRVYPGREDSLGVSLRALGNDAELKLLNAWQMENIYQSSCLHLLRASILSF